MPELSSAMPLDEKAYREIHEAARTAKIAFDKSYAPCDIPVQSDFGWWVMKETERRILSSLTPSPVGELHPVSMSMFATKDDMLRHLLAERVQTAASLTSLSAEVARKDAEIERLRADADRWRALLRCARIRMFGSAGVNPKTGEREQYSNATQKMEKTSDGWVHFGAEFWSVYPGAENYDGTNEWGVHALTALADDVMLKERAALSAPKGGEHV